MVASRKHNERHRHSWLCALHQIQLLCSCILNKKSNTKSRRHLLRIKSNCLFQLLGRLKCQLPKAMTLSIVLRNWLHLWLITTLMGWTSIFKTPSLLWEGLERNGWLGSQKNCGNCCQIELLVMLLKLHTWNKICIQKAGISPSTRKLEISLTSTISSTTIRCIIPLMILTKNYFYPPETAKGMEAQSKNWWRREFRERRLWSGSQPPRKTCTIQGTWAQRS